MSFLVFERSKEIEGGIVTGVVQYPGLLMIVQQLTRGSFRKGKQQPKQFKERSSSLETHLDGKPRSP